MKIATFNVKNKTADLIFHGKRKLYEKYTLNAELIKKANPDIIGLQEMTKSELSYLKKAFEDEYDFYGEFRGSLGFTNECCPIMVKKDNLIILESSTLSLSNDIHILGKKYFGAMFPRICTDIYIDDGIDLYHISNVQFNNATHNNISSSVLNFVRNCVINMLYF